MFVCVNECLFIHGNIKNIIFFYDVINKLCGIKTHAKKHCFYSKNTMILEFEDAPVKDKINVLNNYYNSAQ